MAQCRTAALGGHLEQCDACGHQRPVYNSCGNRHCPMCQGKLARRWVAARMSELLPVPYFHVIFTLPDTFNVLLARNQTTIYDLVLRTAADTLLHFADQQFHGLPAITAVLHTWGQTLWQHIHAHFIVSGGALRHDGKRWVKGQADFLFDVRKLSAEFRDRFCRRLGRARLDFSGDAAALADPAAFAAFLQAEASRDWVVYCKKPFAGPAEVLEYIGRYTHRVAIANGRILEVGDDGTVTIDYKDYHDQDARGAARHKTMTLAAFEFLRRFLLHVLPHGFRKIRFYGLLAGADRRARLARCRDLLGVTGGSAEVVARAAEAGAEERDRCPICGRGQMRRVAALIRERGPPVVLRWVQGEARHAA